MHNLIERKIEGIVPRGKTRQNTREKVESACEVIPRSKPVNITHGGFNATDN
jgi:hypothetical protein